MTSSEAELRAMSRDDLVAYALKLQEQRHSTATAPTSASPTDAGTRSPPRKKRKSKRAFDMSRYGQRMIALKIAYLGWPFHGFASQPNITATVEAHLFAALTKTHLVADRVSCAYSRAGRTDVGVSALSQIVGVRVRSSILPPACGDSELPYVHVLNACLPPAIRVLAWAPVADGNGGPLALPGDSPEVHASAAAMAKLAETATPGSVRRPGAEFSARFDATHRAYKYFFVRGGLDVEAMREGGRFFEGRHNFRNFCKADESVTNFDRLMYNVEVHRAKDHARANVPANDPDGEHEVYYIYVKGQAFLWHQVRCMAAILFEVGRGREQPVVIRRMLADVTSGEGAFARGKPQYRMASPLPLLLHECAYPPSVLSFPAAATFEGSDDGAARWRRPEAFARADGELTKEYGALRLKAAVVREMLSMNDAVSVRHVVDADKNGVEKSFGELRLPRSFLLDIPHSTKHVPLDQRSKEPHAKVSKEDN